MWSEKALEWIVKIAEAIIMILLLIISSIVFLIFSPFIVILGLFEEKED